MRRIALPCGAWLFVVGVAAGAPLSAFALTFTGLACLNPAPGALAPLVV